jgi:hypothetical protein
MLLAVQSQQGAASREAPSVQSHGPRSKLFPIGPFARYFTVVGYMVVSVIASAVGLELLLWIAWSASNLLMPKQQPDPASSPAYSGDAWAAGFWKEESERSKVHRSYILFRVWGIWHGMAIT